MRCSSAVAAVFLLFVAAASAQEVAGPGRLESTFMPGGMIFFNATNSGPDFGSYQIGGTVTYNVNSIVGIEGEIGGMLGLTQNLRMGPTVTAEKTPDMLGYSTNLVVSAPMYGRFVPYGTAGGGGLTMFQRAGLTNTETFLTGNTGGGFKWYANALWGLRVDYRFIAVRSAGSQAGFFGQQNRFGHRVYAGAVVNFVR